jgi:hypothetical protein
MADFKAITTQEEFDGAIRKRLEQKDRELAEQYRDYLSPDKVDALKADYDKKMTDTAAALKAAQEQIAGYDKEKADLLTRATAAEASLLKGRVASKYKIPLELAERLVGDTEEALEHDAATFAGYMAPPSAAPMRTNDPAPGGSAENAAQLAFKQWFDTMTQN